MLVAFPENYRLYEHVKKTEKDGKVEVKSKTHAAAGNERQDAYLYGHPEGRRKRYRSPADFFPHLLWLTTDESGDPENCGCKICSPDDIDEPRPVGRPRTKMDPEVKVDPGVGMARQGSGQGPTKPKQEPQSPIPVQRPPATSRPLMPTPLAQPRTPDQRIDLQYRGFMYRPGEVVWFRRAAAWGLGVVMRRWFMPNQYYYTVQPLSNPQNHPAPVIKSSSAELRPWLAWSVPRYLHDSLNDLQEPPTYETIDWPMMNERYGLADMEVDGSILAAKSADSSYTPFQPISSIQLDLGISETSYNGIFLGGEKVWIGDPLRLARDAGTDILVLHSITERKRTVHSNTPQIQQSVYLTGDVYQLQRFQHNDLNVPTLASPANNPHLPQRLTEDLTYRNTRTIPARQVAVYWKLLSAQTRLELKDIKGRWYEASLLLPVLQESVFEDSASKGEIQEASLWMNARGDCINANRHPSLPRISWQNVRKETRREAFGPAIPADAEIRDGVEPPLPENVDPALELMASQSSMDIDPKFDTAAGGVGSSDEIRVSRPGELELEEGHEGGGIDEFMNLDGMEEGQSQMPGFGKEYGSQADGRGYF